PARTRARWARRSSRSRSRPSSRTACRARPRAAAMLRPSDGCHSPRPSLYRARAASLASGAAAEHLVERGEVGLDVRVLGPGLDPFEPHGLAIALAVLAAD